MNQRLSGISIVLNNLFRALRRNIEKVIEPVPSVQDVKTRHKARMLALVLLVGIALIILAQMLLHAAGLQEQTRPLLVSHAISIPALVVGYLLCRRGRVIDATVLVIALTGLSIVMPSLVFGGSVSYNLLYYLVSAPLVSAYTLSLRSTLIITLLVNIVLIVIAPVVPGTTAEQILFGPLLFNLLLGSGQFVILFVLRADAEQQRSSLAASEQRYRLITDMISDYAYLVRLEPDGKLKREWITEDSYQRITGFTPEHLDKILAHNTWIDEYPDKLRPHVIDAMQRAIQGEANDQEIHFFNRENQRRWLHIHRRPIRDAEGRITHVLGVAQDITARKEAELRLRESEERYRTLSELISDYAFYFRIEDEESHLEWITNSFERITGFHVDEIYPNNGSKMFHKDDLEKLQRDVAAVRQGQETSSEIRITTKSGEPRVLVDRRRPVWNDERTKVIGYYTVVEDITERKLTEAQERKILMEEEALRMIRQFMLAISHDFRTLLATIETSRYLIERRLDAEARAQVQPKLNRIHEAVTHINAQLDNLQLVTTISSHTATPVPVRDFLEAVTASHQDAAAAQGVSLKFCPGSDMPPVVFDEDKIRTALHHLIRNALSNTPAGGSVMLRTAQEDDCLVIEVADTGSGILPEDIPHIFQAFYRTDEARQVERGGLGLGLTLVKMIIEGHDGRVDVESRPGQGSTFRIFLPVNSKY